MAKAHQILEALRQRGLTLATAESCTGGNIAHLLTLVPGASDVFRGGVVSYSNDIKIALLGVDPLTLKQYGAVSDPVVRQMAQGARQHLQADASVATSGVAGPGGGSPDKPVGTVFIAVDVLGQTISAKLQLQGPRSKIIDDASSLVLDLLYDTLLKSTPEN